MVKILQLSTNSTLILQSSGKTNKINHKTQWFNSPIYQTPSK